MTYFRLGFIVLLAILTSCRSKVLNTPSVLGSPSSQPSPPALSLGDAMGSVYMKNQRRTYLLFTPKSYRQGTPAPLVLAFHGYGSQGKDLERATGFSEVAERESFLIVYPDGLDRQWQTGKSFFDRDRDDPAFALTLIRQIAQIRSIDTNRIYATGVSNGGFLVQYLACQNSKASPRFAVFATVASTMLKPFQADCPSKAPISMLMINGTADQKIPWLGGIRPYGSLLGVEDTIAFWSRRNGCANNPPARVSLNKLVEIQRYGNCRSAGEVELVSLKGIGHLWPRGGGGNNSLLNASQEIWDFFKRNSLQKRKIKFK